jgi:hypothetical protein
MESTEVAREVLISAVLSLVAARAYADLNPEDGTTGWTCELHLENVDDAAEKFARLKAGQH